MTASLSRRSLIGAGAIGLAAFAVPGLTGCSAASESPASKGAPPVKGGTLRVGLTGEARQSLSTHTSSSSHGSPTVPTRCTRTRWPATSCAAKPPPGRAGDTSRVGTDLRAPTGRRAQTDLSIAS